MTIHERETATEYILERITQAELLAQLAEEAAELAHAALKLRRVYDGSNPTPVKGSVAYSNVKEEVADVLLLVGLLELDRDLGEIQRIMNRKTERWKGRLEDLEARCETCGHNGWDESRCKSCRAQGFKSYRKEEADV